MGWDYDKPVIEYLERRIKYYQRLLRGYTRLLNQPSKEIGNYFNMTKLEYKKAVKLFIQKTNNRIKEYQHAVEVLKKSK